MAEHLLRHRLEQTGSWQGKVFSAGVSALVMQPADAVAVALMQDHNIDLSSHRAKQLTSQHLQQADLILVMEKYHKEAVLDLDLTARGKTFLLGHWNSAEIADPYLRSDNEYINTLKSIDDCLMRWVEKIDTHCNLFDHTTVLS
jgi:protein-tyrosine phosphatase